MNYEQPPFDDQHEPKTYVKDLNLAYDMAHAEKPYRDAIFGLGKAVVAVPSEAIRSLEVSADNASNLVGQQYVTQEQAKLSDYVAGEQAKLDALREQFGGDGAEQTKTVETHTSLEKWAMETRKALFEQYKQHGCEGREVSLEDFELLSYKRGGNIVHAVTYTAPKGLDLGNPNKDRDPARSHRVIMANREKAHTVVINGQRVSTLGMNFDLYEAMVAKAKTEKRDLPDSAANRLSNEWYTWTLMPAEPLADGVPPRVAGVDGDGSVDRDVTYPDYGYRNLLFRPVVEKEEQR